MDLRELREQLDRLPESLSEEERALLGSRLTSLVSVFPFSEYEYTLMFLLDRGVVSFDEYEGMRGAYVAANRYLNLFELGPRAFGETWCQQHLIDLDPRFNRASKELDSGYVGQYDLWIEGVRVEVKASRAVRKARGGSLSSKALSYGPTEPFWMNFQQIKPEACDVFVLVGVWLGEIDYWVLTRDEITPHLIHQHRGGIEYQLGITHANLASFASFRETAQEVGNAALTKGRQQSGD